MSEYKETLFGASARVSFDLRNNIAYWQPRDAFSSADLARKVRLTKQFNQIITQAQVHHIYPLHIMEATSSKVITGLVRGVDVGFSRRYEEIADFLLVRSPEARLNSLIAYLRAIDALNQRGLIFKDHKPDSIIYPYQTPDGPDGGISVIDVDGMIVCSSPVLAWKIDRTILTPQPTNTFDLEMFFTKGLTVETIERNFGSLSEGVGKLPFDKLIPVGVALTLQRDFPYSNSAAEVAEKLEGYRDGSYQPPFHSDDPLHNMSTADAYRVDMRESFEAGIDVAKGLLDIYQK